MTRYIQGDLRRNIGFFKSVKFGKIYEYVFHIIHNAINKETGD